MKYTITYITVLPNGKKAKGTATVSAITPSLAKLKLYESENEKGHVILGIISVDQHEKRETGFNQLFSTIFNSKQ